jgi:hypothetical protein
MPKVDAKDFDAVVWNAGASSSSRNAYSLLNMGENQHQLIHYKPPSTPRSETKHLASNLNCGVSSDFDPN